MTERYENIRLALANGPTPGPWIVNASAITELLDRLEAVEKERDAKRVFGGNYSTIQWLDPWCRIPSSWHAADEDGLKAEFKEAAKDD